MCKRSVFILIFFCCATCIRAQGTNLTSLLSNLNISDIYKGINISDDLKRELIDCITIDANGKPSYEKCPNDKISFPDALKGLFPEPTTTEAPKKGLLGLIDTIKDAVIVKPITTVTDVLKTVVQDGASKISEVKGTLTGAKEEAEALIALAGDIKADKPNRDPHDPYQDISDVLIEKHKGNIQSNPLAVAQNRKALVDTFANTDTATIRRYGASYNPLIPNNILYGLLKTIAEV